MRAINHSRKTELATMVETANSFWKRLRGLLGRRALENGEGLWIVPCRGVHTHGMTFDIDVLFLDANLRVLACEEHFKPGRISGLRWGAKSVLELSAGSVRRSGTCIGDKIEFLALEA